MQILFVSCLLVVKASSTVVDTPTGGQAYDCANINNNYSKLGYYNAPQTEGVVFILKKSLDNFSSEDINTDSYLLGLEGKRYNWWQVMLDNGGRPGTLKKIKKSNSSNLYTDPCRRPLPYKAANITDVYFYEASNLKTFYREETARKAFVGTPKEFLHVFGTLIWTPPPEANDTRVYKILYALDDTGFWVRIEPELCRFDSGYSEYSGDKEPELYCTPLVSRPGYDTLPGNLLQSFFG